MRSHLEHWYYVCIIIIKINITSNSSIKVFAFFEVFPQRSPIFCFWSSSILKNCCKINWCSNILDMFIKIHLILWSIRVMIIILLHICLWEEVDGTRKEEFLSSNGHYQMNTLSLIFIVLCWLSLPFLRRCFEPTLSFHRNPSDPFLLERNDPKVWLQYRHNLWRQPF